MRAYDPGAVGMVEAAVFSAQRRWDLLPKDKVKENGRRADNNTGHFRGGGGFQVDIFV